MTSEPEHLTLNRGNWDDRAPVHAAAPYYEWDRFVADPTHLSKVVEFDRPRLPELDGAEGVRLDRLEEHDSVPFCPFPGQMSPVDPADTEGLGEWRLTERPERVALSFTLLGTRV